MIREVDADRNRRRHKGSSIGAAFGQQMLARGVGILASLVTVSLTSRTLGPDRYGLLTAAVMFVALWTCLTELGIGAVIVRRVTGTGNDLYRLVRVNLGLSLVLSLPLMLTAIGVGLLSYGSDSDHGWLIAIISTSLLLTTLSTAFDPIFMVHMRFGAAAWSDVLGRVGSLVMTLVLVTMDASLYWYAVVQLVPPAGTLIIKWIAAVRISRLAPVFSVTESWSLIRESLPQTAVLIIAVLYWRIDGVILSLLADEREVGAYGLAYSLAFMVAVVPQLFLSTTLSTATELLAVDRRRFTMFTARSLELMYFVAAPVAVVGGVLSGPLMALVGSHSFRFGGTMLALLLVAAAGTVLNATVSQTLFAAHDQVFLMRLNIVNLTVNVVLNLLLIPLAGAEGAAIALIVTEVIGLLAANIRLYRRGFPVQPWRFIVRLAIPVALSAMVAYLLRHETFAIAAVAPVVTYLGANFVAGPVSLGYLRSRKGAGSDHV